MPGFLTAGMSEEQINESLGPLATGLSEAIIETLEQRHGYLVIRKDELRQAAKQLDGDNMDDLDGVPIHCNRCRTVVIQRLRLGDYVKIHVPTVIAALQAHEQNCQ